LIVEDEYWQACLKRACNVSEAGNLLFCTIVGFSIKSYGVRHFFTYWERHEECKVADGNGNG
jgi:hypothetical protein